MGATVYLGAEHLRRQFREQMVNHDGDILDAVAQAQQISSGAETNLNARLQTPADQLALALNISQLKEGVLAVRLYDADGKFVTAFPPYVSEVALSSEALAELKKLHPISLYLPSAHFADLFLAPEIAGAGDHDTPLLEVTIPIHAHGQETLLASAQLILDARSLARDFAKLDEQLWWQAFAVFLVGGVLLSAALVWAYRRLQNAHALLQERTARLLRANHELTLAAKTGALGAVTAHLVHGLSNPLANLQNFVAGQNGHGSTGDHWQGVVTATQQMQKLVQDVVRVLGEASGTDHYEISLGELSDILSAKLQPTAQDLGVRCAVHVSAEGQLSNRHANLILLILENLVQNAFQVTPRGKLVQVAIVSANDGVVCQVTDQGSGFPPHLLKNIFAPCRSTKGGSGLGLAISRQLANQLGAQLELARSGPDGCVFALNLPRAVFGEEKLETTTALE